MILDSVDDCTLSGKTDLFGLCAFVYFRAIENHCAGSGLSQGYQRSMGLDPASNKLKPVFGKEVQNEEVYSTFSRFIGVGGSDAVFQSSCSGSGEAHRAETCSHVPYRVSVASAYGGMGKEDRRR
jgi:hypothetical protein